MSSGGRWAHLLHQHIVGAAMQYDINTMQCDVVAVTHLDLLFLDSILNIS